MRRVGEAKQIACLGPRLLKRRVAKKLVAAVDRMRGARLRAVLTGTDDDGCLIVVASASIEVGRRVVLQERLGLWTEQAARNHAIREWTPADWIHDLNRAAEGVD